MTPLEQFNEEVMKEFDEIFDPIYIEVEASFLKDFITQKLAAHKELILKMVREKAPITNDINKNSYSDRTFHVCKFYKGVSVIGNECQCLGFREGIKEFLNNLDTI